MKTGSRSFAEERRHPDFEAAAGFSRYGPAIRSYSRPSTNVVPVVRPENSIRQPVHRQQAIAIPADVDRRAHLSEKGSHLLDRRFLAFEMDMEIHNSTVKAAVMQVVEPPAGLEDVAV
jgi:hypothetical protein